MRHKLTAKVDPELIRQLVPGALDRATINEQLAALKKAIFERAPDLHRAPDLQLAGLRVLERSQGGCGSAEGGLPGTVHSTASPLVDGHFRPGHQKRPPDRGILRLASGPNVPVH